MRLLFVIAAGLILVACTASAPEGVCDRDAQEWDKFGTVEDDCGTPTLIPPIIPPILPPVCLVDCDPEPPCVVDCDPEPPCTVDCDPKPPCTDCDPGPKPKGNNGWGNGDQDAPGKSKPNNNAENGPRGDHDGRGGGSANTGNDNNR